MLKAVWAPYTLHFKETAITSRARMLTKDTYYIKVYDPAEPHRVGWGEIPLFRGLSAEDAPDYEDVLNETCERIGSGEPLPPYSSIRFGFEMALNDLRNGARQVFFDTPWAQGRTAQQINGLIWMGDKHTMSARIRMKLDAGFKCVKLKIGGINFDDELDLLRIIRREFDKSRIELRLDANGAFTPQNALHRLDKLSAFDIHSIEQPIKAGQWEAMQRIASESPIPIALDEELIGCHDLNFKHEMLRYIRPSYIILKPALCGGFHEADEWIQCARENGIGWWATSALESDLGLDAIAQWVSAYKPSIPQGLGTGQLYTNNIPSPVTLSGEMLQRRSSVPYDFTQLNSLNWN